MPRFLRDGCVVLLSLLFATMVWADMGSAPFVLEADSSGATLNGAVDYFIDARSEERRVGKECRL